MSDWDWDGGSADRHGPLVAHKVAIFTVEGSRKIRRPMHRPTGKEWLPAPYHGSHMVPGRKPPKKESIYVQIVPGPGNRWMIVRMELATPVARGFKSKESARKWIERSIKEGILPPGVVEVEPGG